MNDEQRIDDARKPLGALLDAATATINSQARAVAPGPEGYKRRPRPAESPVSIEEHGEAVAQALTDMADRHFRIAEEYEKQALKARDQAAAAAQRHASEIERYKKIADILDPPPAVTEVHTEH